MLLYYALVFLLIVLAGPFLLAAPKRRAGLSEKLGSVAGRCLRVAQDDGKSVNVWFHAVSVGEFNAVWPLIQAFSQRHPQAAVWITTATETAQNLARQKMCSDERVFYFPLDLPFAIGPWLDTVRPDLVVIAETEIWPGFTYECTRRRVGIVVVNGRISSRSLPSYKRFAFLFAPTIARFAAILAQSDLDAERYRAIAGPDIDVVTTGNLKFDGLTPITRSERDGLAARLNLSPTNRVLVAGSTHEGEEKAVLAAFSTLIGKLPSPTSARLILVPRHPERFDRVAELIESHGFRARRYSRNESLESDRDVFLLDTIGQLFAFYALADVAFVGGTLAPIGGHNLLEPYAYGVPVIAGPSLDKTLDVARGLQERQALTVVADGRALSDGLALLWGDAELRRQLGERGRQWLIESEGAVGRTLAVVESLLAKTYNTGNAPAQATLPEATGPSGD